MQGSTKDSRGKDLYRQAGVDLDKAGELVRRIQPLVHSTYDEGVITEIGGFGGLYALDCKEGDRPVLVSSTDGVGTKLKVAFWAGRHETVGIDLVAMCVNDILVQGARPLFFLDYLSMGRMDLDILEQVVTGIAEGCKEARCALIGGETAEMPGFYEANEYDMAGFAVGVVDRSRIKDGSAIREGDRIIGLASSGLHSNGYSLVRRILIEQMGLQPESFLDECRRTAAEELLEPTRIYVRPVLDLLERFNVNGMVHITGGGFHDNIPRVLPRSCRALLYEDSWDIPPIFDFLREKGGISSEEMGHVFNNGIGYILVVGADEARAAMERLEMLGQKAYQIGEIAAKEGNEPTVAFIRR